MTYQTINAVKVPDFRSAKNTFASNSAINLEAFTVQFPLVKADSLGREGVQVSLIDRLNRWPIGYSL